FALLASRQVRHLYYAFDEASREMACFNAIAPYLDVLIHDEAPLAPEGRARLRPGCQTLHRSWVANFAPGEAPFNPQPEEKIYFLGSQLGLTAHRQRQFDFLREKFKNRFVASHDHTTAVDARAALNRYKVGLCPEGRKFTTPAMSATHTDRPFWSGCLGMVPVSEDSRQGGRLEELHAERAVRVPPQQDRPDGGRGDGLLHLSRAQHQPAVRGGLPAVHPAQPLSHPGLRADLSPAGPAQAAGGAGAFSPGPEKFQQQRLRRGPAAAPLM
ncbi:MAG: hypothetical protein ABUL61_05765, partial [Oleiharenicola lentus]